MTDTARPVRERSRTRGSGSAPARRALLLLVGAAVFTVVAAVAGIGLGSHPVSPATILRALVDYDPAQDDHLIVMESRLPRIVLGVVVGAALGAAGTLMQSLTRNPLADPGILGVNAGAALSVTIGIGYFGITSVSGYIWLSFVGAGAAAVLVYALGAAHRSAATPVRIALAGTAVSIAITAVTQMVLLSDETAFQYFRFWSVGSLQGRGFGVIAAVLPFVLVGLAAAIILSGPLDAVALGDAAARSLGTRVGSTRASAAAAVVLLAGAATAAAGPIGFIGLAGAHISRRVTGDSHRWLIPCSAVVGAGLLVGADALGRALVAPADLQSGIAAALIGSPLFVLLVRSRRVASL